MATRKKAPKDPEIVPDEVEIEAKPINPAKKKIVESRVVTYDAPVDQAEDEPEEEEYDYEERPKKAKPTLKQEKLKLRERWAKKGIAPTGNLRVSIFRFTNEDDPMSGPQADKAYCTKFNTTAEAIDEGIHLDAAAKFGPGRYWLMVYLNNQICDQWEFRIAGNAGMGAMQNGQQVVSMPDPQNPGQVIVQMPQQPVQAPQVDINKLMREHMKGVRETAEMMGWIPANQQQQTPQAQLTPEQNLAATLLLDPDVKRKAVKSLLGSAGDDDAVSWAGVVKDLVTSEQGPLVVRELVNGFFSGFQGMFNFGGKNGQAPMVQAPHAQVGQADSQQQTDGQNGQIQALQESNRQTLSGNTETGSEESISPEDQLLNSMLDSCKRRIPPKIAAKRAVDYADLIETQAPHLSVYGFIEYLNDNDIESILPFIENYNDLAKEVLALPHAKEWAKQFQVELKGQYEQGGNENGIQS